MTSLLHFSEGEDLWENSQLGFLQKFLSSFDLGSGPLFAELMWCSFFYVLPIRIPPKTVGGGYSSEIRQLVSRGTPPLKTDPQPTGIGRHGQSTMDHLTSDRMAITKKAKANRCW
jgi:hypothetical protein